RARDADPRRGADGGRSLGLVASLEQPVDGGAGAAHVGAERARSEELLDEGLPSRRLREIVRRQRRRIALLQRREDGIPALAEPRPAAERVEAGVDGAGRGLRGPFGERE